MAHIHKDIDFTVSVFVVNTGRVLLHVHQKYNQWLPPGGHIELTENPNEAALREVKEECGLDIVLCEPRETPVTVLEEEGFVSLVSPFYFNIHTAAPEHRHADFVYFATTESDVVVPEKEGEEWRWWSRDELEKEKGLWPSVRLYALEALRLVDQQSATIGT